MKFRTENKYICDNSQSLQIQCKLERILQHDKNSKANTNYDVHSLYFDDYKNTCAFENDAGVSERYKWRIRYYNENISFLKLEKKEKINNLCRKKSCQISLDEVNDILQHNFWKVIWSTKKDLLKEFCIESINKIIRPVIIVDYVRTAFVEPISNIRITFDKNISGSKQIDRFLYNDFIKYPVIDSNRQILEVKYDEILPSYIRQAVNKNGLNQNTFSKYYLCRSFLERN